MDKNHYEEISQKLQRKIEIAVRDIMVQHRTEISRAVGDAGECYWMLYGVMLGAFAKIAEEIRSRWIF